MIEGIRFLGGVDAVIFAGLGRRGRGIGDGSGIEGEEVMGKGGEQAAASRREDFLYSEQVRLCPIAIQTHAHTRGLVSAGGARCCVLRFAAKIVTNSTLA